MSSANNQTRKLSNYPKIIAESSPIIRQISPKRYAEIFKNIRQETKTIRKPKLLL